MDVHRFGVKFYAADGITVELQKIIPIFHRWIQRQHLTGHQLIDVHDYSHVHNGPGILLVGHEGNFSIDSSDARLGLMYYRKTPTGLSTTEHLVTILRSALQACRFLEKDAKLRFNADEFVVVTNDRLKAPNDDTTFREMTPLLSAALAQTFEGAAFDLARTSTDDRDRLTITCRRTAM